MTDIAPNPTPKRKSPLWVKIALTFSLVLNLGLAGMLVGLATRSMRDGSVVTAAIAALPEQDRAALRREARDSFRTMRDKTASAQARADLLTILTEEPFDPVAFDAALAQSRAHVAEMGAQMRARVVARVAEMTVEERRAYAADLRKRLERRSSPSGRP